MNRSASKFPLPPRIAAPDLPRELEPLGSIERHGDLLHARIEGLSGTVDAAHAHLTESEITAAAADLLDLAGATLTDVAFRDLRATEVKGRDTRWRTVLVSGGRIGTLDLTAAELTTVELRGLRIDYLSLGSAKISDLVMVDCTIGSLDVPGATLSRVGFENTRVDEMDTRGLCAEHLDLRGADVLSFTDPTALRGATLSSRQVELLAPALAAALGIRVRD